MEHTSSPPQKSRKSPRSSSFHPHGVRRRSSMEGIRLRSDSNGSMKSAFYQGTIVSAPAGPTHELANAHHDDGEPAGAAPGLRNRRSSNRRPSSRRNSNPQSRKSSSSGYSMSDAANMARSSLGGEHNYFGADDGRHHGQSRNSRGFTPMGHPHENLPESATPRMETIADDLEYSGHFPDDMLQQSQTDAKPTAHDSLRYSDASIMRSSAFSAALYGTDIVDNSPRDSSRLSNIMGINQLDSVRTSTSINSEASLSAVDMSRWSIRSDLSSASGAFFHQTPSSGLLTNNGRFPVQASQESGHASPMAHTNYGTSGEHIATPEAENRKTNGSKQFPMQYATATEGKEDEESEYSEESLNLVDRFMDAVVDWLSSGVAFDESGAPYFPEGTKWTMSGIIRVVFFNPVYPEFTSLQQFTWAVIIGIGMGFYTAGWKLLIESCVDFVWKAVPETLLEWGLFTELDGNFPLYHYMWIVPTIFGGILSYIFAALPTPIPGQNEWIHNLHSRGVQESDTFVLLFILATAGFASGLSLGPELPLILTAGMIGSWLGVVFKQSMLQARVLNLTSASAAIGGYFGFPMAGALFALEIPHRMGLQYFEALSPATIASIVAVLTNRMVTGNDVTGYFEYPFLNSSLPSQIFTNAIFYGLFGAGLGILYIKVVLYLKHFMHAMFHEHHDDHDDHDDDVHAKHAQGDPKPEEEVPLVDQSDFKTKMQQPPSALKRLKSLVCFAIPHEPTRAGISGALAGLAVGVTGMFIPHVMFWGEAQLQNLIDKGRTPLPVFGHGDEPTAGLTALGYCMMDEESTGDATQGFSLGCAATITLAKIFVTGLSLGTGIIGGHFWGPLFAGCAASHFLTDLVNIVSSHFGISNTLAAYPCVSLLCIMGSTHVVTFRAHTAIILILTLTIDAFDPEGTDGTSGERKVAGDYSAVFPLLTVSVYVALQLSRTVVFYAKQRSRGDIMALPEVLCEPGKEGKPLVMGYDGHLHELDESDYEYETDPDDESGEFSDEGKDTVNGETNRAIDGGVTQRDIEAHFEATKAPHPVSPFANNIMGPTSQDQYASSEGSVGRTASPLPPRRRQDSSKPPRSESPEDKSAYSSRLDELLGTPLDTQTKKTTHRRTLSAPQDANLAGERKTMSANLSDPQLPIDGTPASGGNAGHRRKLSGGGALMRVNSFGQVDQEQPSLLDQARLRAASFNPKARQIQQRQLRNLSPTNDTAPSRRIRAFSADVPPPPPSADGSVVAPSEETSGASGQRSPWTENQS